MPGKSDEKENSRSDGLQKSLLRVARPIGDTKKYHEILRNTKKYQKIAGKLRKNKKSRSDGLQKN